MYQIGIIGTGARSLSFAKYIKEHKLCKLRAVCDIDLPRTEVFKRLADANVDAFGHHRDLISCKDLDAVVITVPDYAQASIMLDALRAGKHVLCEKPMATTLNDANQLRRALNQHRKVTCFVALVLRFHEFYRVLGDAIPKVGNLGLVTATDYVPGAFYFRRWQRLRKKSGGLILHEGIHSLDIIQRAISKDPHRVWAAGKLQFYKSRENAADRCLGCALSSDCAEYFDFFADPMLELYHTPSQQEGYPRDLCVYTSEKDTPDTAVAHIEYENGPLATYQLCLFSPFRTRKFTFAGDGGILVADERSSTILFYPSDNNSPENWRVNVPESPYGGGDQRLFNAFVGRLGSVRTDCTSIREAFSSLILALALEQSMINNKSITIGRQRDGTIFFT